MTVAITLDPTDPTAVVDAVRLDVTGASANDVADYDVNDYPSRAAIKCYLRFVKGGVEYGRSYVFTVGQDGKHSFPNYIFPSSGSWTVTLCRADTDAVLATQAVTVG